LIAPQTPNPKEAQEENTDRVQPYSLAAKEAPRNPSTLFRDQAQFFDGTLLNADDLDSTLRMQKE
jgi:hypothetical protein